MRRGKSLRDSCLRPLGRLVPALVCLCAVILASPAVRGGEERTLSIYNIHTKETVTVTYKKDGVFVPEAMKQLNRIMRDWRRDEATEMDPELIDLIWAIHQDLGSKEPVHLISGYRSRTTNNMLRRVRGGQARNSRHILGKAADIHFPDVPIKRLRNSALLFQTGGVGYYPTSSIPFVHVDTGRVRHWPRMPRQEYAALMRSGKKRIDDVLPSSTVVADARDAARRPQERAPATPVAIAPARVADVADTIARQHRRTQEMMTLTAQPNPSVVAAGLGPLSLPWLARASGITGAIPRPDTDEPDAPVRLASADPTAPVTAEPGAPAITRAVVATAPEYDPEHPEELSYQPFSITPFLKDTGLARDGDVVALEAPLHGEVDYLLTSPDRGLPLPIRPVTGARKIAAAWEFTGPAVRNLLPPEPARDGGKVLTADRRDDAPLPDAAPAPGTVPASALGFGAIPR